MDHGKFKLLQIQVFMELKKLLSKGHAPCRPGILSLKEDPPVMKTAKSEHILVSFTIKLALELNHGSSEFQNIANTNFYRTNKTTVQRTRAVLTWPPLFD